MFAGARALPAHDPRQWFDVRRDGGGGGWVQEFDLAEYQRLSFGWPGELPAASERTPSWITRYHLPWKAKEAAAYTGTVGLDPGGISA